MVGKDGVPDSEEQRFKQKCKELKKRITEVEESNEIATIALSRTKTAIRRLRLEYSVLLERLEERAIQSNDAEEMLPPPLPTYLDESLTNSKKNGASKKVSRRGGNRGGNAAANGSKPFKIRDPDLPKRPTNAYLIFCQMEKDRIRQEAEMNGETVADLLKLLTECWKKLDEGKRRPYYKLNEDDRDRYQREMVAYNLRKQDEKPEEEEEEEETVGPVAKKLKLEDDIRVELTSEIDTPASEMDD